MALVFSDRTLLDADMEPSVSHMRCSMCKELKPCCGCEPINCRVPPQAPERVPTVLREVAPRCLQELPRDKGSGRANPEAKARKRATPLRFCQLRVGGRGGTTVTRMLPLPTHRSRARALAPRQEGCGAAVFDGEHRVGEALNCRITEASTTPRRPRGKTTCAAQTRKFSVCFKESHP